MTVYNEPVKLPSRSVQRWPISAQCKMYSKIIHVLAYSVLLETTQFDRSTLFHISGDRAYRAVLHHFLDERRNFTAYIAHPTACNLEQSASLVALLKIVHSVPKIPDHFEAL